ncbi:2757_t:CDS:1 [Paraglomus brasilianum]|uniref:2757_t:CDS:1 n=1 Tax=Paraglomus brasilianum TaxID=144538 RepID=A0A9N9FCP7_9GLOM|nr:2757_t:CDS:1 [Paraglomus brasilianum]
MKSVYLIFLVTLLAVISTPANASPLEKRWTNPKDCCPIAKCVFKKFDKPTKVNGVTLGNNYHGNTFDGFLTFAESSRNKKLHISGWINIDGVTPNPNPFTQPTPPANSVEGFYDIHVAKCNTANSNTPSDIGDIATIDLDYEGFSKPIITSIPDSDLNRAFVSIETIKDQCCFVVEEYASVGPPPSGTSGANPKNERILGIAPIEIVERCDTRP